MKIGRGERVILTYFFIRSQQVARISMIGNWWEEQEYDVSLREVQRDVKTLLDLGIAYRANGTMPCRSGEQIYIHKGWK